MSGVTLLRIGLSETPTVPPWVTRHAHEQPAVVAVLGLLVTASMAALSLIALTLPGFFEAWGPAMQALLVPNLPHLPLALWGATEGLFGARPPVPAALDATASEILGVATKTGQDVRLEVLALLANAVESRLCQLRAEGHPAHHVVSNEAAAELLANGVPKEMLLPAPGVAATAVEVPTLSSPPMHEPLCLLPPPCRSLPPARYVLVPAIRDPLGLIPPSHAGSCCASPLPFRQPSCHAPRTGSPPTRNATIARAPPQSSPFRGSLPRLPPPCCL